MIYKTICPARPGQCKTDNEQVTNCDGITIEEVIWQNDRAGN